MKFKINNKTGSPIHYEKEIHSLCDFAQQRLGFKKPPSIFLNHDKHNAKDTLAKTGHYDPNTMEIHVFATGRHPKDILRSISHELVHHDQHMRGDLDLHGYSGKGYAQKNPKLRKAEIEANDPMLFRDWEDSIKEKENTIYSERRNRKMSLKEWKNKELGSLLNNKWGFKMDLSKLNEAANEKREELEEGEIPDGLKKHMEKEKAKKKGDEEKEEKPEGEDKEKDDSKPDFLDLDGDGDKNEPMKQAAKQAKNESINKNKLVNEVMKKIRTLIIKGNKY